MIKKTIFRGLWISCIAFSGLALGAVHEVKDGQSIQAAVTKAKAGDTIKVFPGEAKKLKIKRLSIETGAGKFFAPARKLFDNFGFKPCPPFAHYKEDVNSLYLTKLLDNS